MKLFDLDIKDLLSFDDTNSFESIRDAEDITVTITPVSFLSGVIVNCFSPMGSVFFDFQLPTSFIKNLLQNQSNIIQNNEEMILGRLKELYSDNCLKSNDLKATLLCMIPCNIFHEDFELPDTSFHYLHRRHFSFLVPKEQVKTLKSYLVSLESVGREKACVLMNEELDLFDTYELRNNLEFTLLAKHPSQFKSDDWFKVQKFLEKENYSSVNTLEMGVFYQSLININFLNLDFISSEHSHIIKQLYSFRVKVLLDCFSLVSIDRVRSELQALHSNRYLELQLKLLSQINQFIAKYPEFSVVLGET